MKKRSHKESGNAILEFTLVAVPLLFSLISTVELARGMWIYSSVAHAVKEGTRFAVVHGQNCVASGASCPVTLATVAGVVQQAAMGLDPAQLNITMTSGSASQSCAPLSSCLSGTGQWPPSASNGIGQAVTITGSYPFNSALSMFWPGTKPMQMGSINLGAESSEEIVF